MSKLTLKEIYRLALIKGMTAKQAGAEFNVNYQSISKMKGRYGLPSLMTEYEYADKQAIKNLSDESLKKYFEVLRKHTISSGNYEFSKECGYVYDELVERGIRKEGDYQK